jgi:hypothetical protein
MEVEMRKIAVLLTALILASLPGAGVAAPASAAATLATIPQPALDIAFPKESPVTNGYNGHNYPAWIGVGEQRAAVLPIVNGAVTGDATRVNKYWPVFGATFAHQRADGGFDYMPVVAGVVQKEEWQPGGVAFWVGDSAVALLVLRSSSLGPQYAARIDALIPKYRLTVHYLAEPSHVASMMYFNRGPRGPGSTNRVLEVAKALIVGGILVNDQQAISEGNQVLGQALAVQDPSGYFPEGPGADSSYSAVSCANLAETALFYDDPRILPALRRGVDWELTRIHSDGRLDVAGNTRTGIGHTTIYGTNYGVNYLDLTRGLAVSGAVLGDANAMHGAVLTATYIKTNPHGP